MVYISQKVIKLFEPNFQGVFLYAYIACSANLSSLALAKTPLSSLQGFKLAKKKNVGLSDNNLTAFLLRQS
jgi:hypothetical protein